MSSSNYYIDAMLKEELVTCNPMFVKQFCLQLIAVSFLLIIGVVEKRTPLKQTQRYSIVIRKETKLLEAHKCQGRLNGIDGRGYLRI